MTDANTLRLRVSRFKVSAADARLADANSESVILEIDKPYATHNGGSLQFGPDGYLYISTGDGGGMYDPMNNAQDTSALLGKILRIDVNRTTGADCGSGLGGRYGIPPGNPLADGYGNVCDEIWAYGLRNPWRISFDRSTADLWIGDVGQDSREEIDFQAARSGGGQNYGWDCREGTLKNTVHDPSSACSAGHATVAPVYEYDHTGKCAITGGYVYRGARYPAFKGAYFFADFCSGELWALKRTSSAPAVSKLAVSGSTLRNWTTLGRMRPGNCRRVAVGDLPAGGSRGDGRAVKGSLTHATSPRASFYKSSVPGL